jgi:hypothetical protein
MEHKPDNPSFAIPPVAPNAFFAVDAICRCAASNGWPTKEAFEGAMQLVLHGVSVSEARALFADAETRLQ